MYLAEVLQQVAEVAGGLQESPGVIWLQSGGGGFHQTGGGACHQEEQGEQGHGGGHGATGVSWGGWGFCTHFTAVRGGCKVLKKEILLVRKR